MGRILFDPGKQDILDVRRRFSPFSNEVCELPVCHILLRELADFLQDAQAPSAFCAYIRRCEAGQPIDGEQSVNEYCFAPLGEGIALRDDDTAYAFVRFSPPQITVVQRPSCASQPKLAHLVMRAYQYIAAADGALLIHAAAVEYRSCGILFCGVSGAGKSSQARLWQRVCGAEALNNDQPCLYFDDTGGLQVHGTPWSGKEPCYRNAHLPVKAIVYVSQSKENRVEQLSAAEAFALLYLNNQPVFFDEQAQDRYTETVLRVEKSVPVFRQFCDLSDDAPQTLHRTLFESDSEG